MFFFLLDDDIPWWMPPVCLIVSLIVLGIIVCAVNSNATVSEPDAPTPMIETMEEQQW